MKKIDINKSLIFSRNIEDLKNSMNYLYQGGYCSNSEDFSDYEEGTLDGVHASNFMFRPFELTQNGNNEFFSYFIPESKAVFKKELKKKELRQFKSIEEFFEVTGFKIGEVVEIKKNGNYTYEEKSIFSGVRVYIDEEFHRKDAVFGASTHSFDELFKHFKYLKNGKWLRFAVEE